MTLAQRRWLLISFTLFFAVFSPLLLLYASGYRYNTRLRKIEQVGLLSLSSPTSHVIATINDTEHPFNGELLLSILPTSQERIVLSKQGYHDWRKTLAIESGRTTFARNIHLFLDVAPQPLEVFTNRLTLLAQDDAHAVYAAPAALVSFDATNQTTVEADLLQTNEPVEQAQLHGDTLVFMQAKQWYRAVITTKAITIHPLIVPDEARSVVVGDGVLFVLSHNRVWEWNDGTLTPLFELDETQAIRQTGKHWFVVAAEATHKRSFLYEVTNVGAKPQFIAALSYSDTWTIADINGTLITLHDDAHQGLYLIDTRIAPPAIATFNGVFAWHWSADHRALLTATPNELSIYRLENGTTQELLLRQSQPITSIAFNDDETWAFYTSGDSIYAIERDDRDGRNNITLADKKTAPMLIGATQDELVFSSQEQTDFVIWSQPLSE